MAYIKEIVKSEFGIPVDANGNALCTGNQISAYGGPLLSCCQNRNILVLCVHKKYVVKTVLMELRCKCQIIPPVVFISDDIGSHDFIYRPQAFIISQRFRKWGGIPSGLTQNVKDLLASREIENIFENSDFIYMLNQAQGDRQILAKQLGISPHQLSYVTHSGPGEGLLFFGNVIIPFVDHFPKDTLLYSVLTTRPDEVAGTKA